MKMTAILWIYYSYKETRHLIRIHPVLYYRGPGSCLDWRISSLDWSCC